MFTVERGCGGLNIVSLDNTGHLEDVELLLGYDSGAVYLRQFNEKNKTYDLIVMTLQQFEDLKSGLSLPAGAYDVKGGTEDAE